MRGLGHRRHVVGPDCKTTPQLVQLTPASGEGDWLRGRLGVLTKRAPATTPLGLRKLHVTAGVTSAALAAYARSYLWRNAGRYWVVVYF